MYRFEGDPIEGSSGGQGRESGRLSSTVSGLGRRRCSRCPGPGPECIKRRRSDRVEAVGLSGGGCTEWNWVV